jgi:hypothetical protein
MTFCPKRIAAPRLIFDAASALAGQVEASTQIDDDDRDRWYNAITKASGRLMDGVRFDVAGDELIFPSRSRNGVSHRTNGACTCEAYTERTPPQPCWHRAARRLIELIADVEHSTLITPPAAPPQCGRCGAAMFEQSGRHVCPRCQHSRQAPAPPARPRPAISAEQAQREIDEIYG